MGWDQDRMGRAMLDVSLGGGDLRVVVWRSRGGTSFCTLPRASRSRVALTSCQKCLLGQSKSHQEPQEPCCLGLNPYVQWVPVKYYFVTRIEQASLEDLQTTAQLHSSHMLVK